MFKEMIETIHKETELVYQGTTSVHEGLGMFVLVMMSHGDVGTISGFNCEEEHGQQTSKHVSLVDIYKLLSSQYFPAMRGKPKLVILQACSGGIIIQLCVHLIYECCLLNCYLCFYKHS